MTRIERRVMRFRGVPREVIVMTITRITKNRRRRLWAASFGRKDATWK